MKYFLYLLLCVAVFVNSACNSENNDGQTGANNQTTTAPPAISYAVVNTYPHDTSSFTQGLVIYKGKLYEGTGGDKDNPVGSKYSRLMQVELQTGKAKKSLDIDPQFFGEGITILNDTLYQLTWTEHKVFAYTLPDFKKVKEFDINTEGWGITNNGKELIVSDGTGNLYFYDPTTFRLLHTQSVSFGGELAYNINELEYIDGYIYANQWGEPYILKIDAASGQIVGRIDVTQTYNRIKQIDPEANVPNGIAYDADTKKVYITGKKWPELYEVQLGR